ncbi:hypothetical protein [uncultured Desulfovibrio sp.]|uniref:hypothetical protein n=1 Tax=uncultured Desulfovibrio sp. TaxID=167968 RepID=UPI0026220C9A|nr:hypothetical protein [uncultured Desulfovibrio sp.]
MEEVVIWIISAVVIGGFGLLVLALFAAGILGALACAARGLMFVIAFFTAVFVVIRHPIDGPKAIWKGWKWGKKHPWADSMSILDMAAEYEKDTSKQFGN